MPKKKTQHHIFGEVFEVEVDLLGNVVEATPLPVEKKPVVVAPPVEVPMPDEYHKENP